MENIFLEIIKRKIKIHERIDMELLSNEYLYDWNVMSCHVRALDCYNKLFDLLKFVFHTSWKFQMSTRQRRLYFSSRWLLQRRLRWIYKKLVCVCVISNNTINRIMYIKIHRRYWVYLRQIYLLASFENLQRTKYVTRKC